MVKNLPASARDASSMPGSGRSPGEGTSNPLQCSSLGNPMDRGAGQATVHRSQRVGHALAATNICMYINVCVYIYNLPRNFTTFWSEIDL